MSLFCEVVCKSGMENGVLTSYEGFVVGRSDEASVLDCRFGFVCIGWQFAYFLCSHYDWFF
jgi:hypothetical protein